MLTNRGRWLTLLSVCGCALGVIRGQELLAYVTMTVLVWLLVEWIVFRWRLAIVCHGISVKRTINGSDAPQTLWMNRPAKVELTIASRVLGGIPFLRLHDFLSAGLETEGNQHIFHVRLRGTKELSYTLIPKAAGQFVLPGVCARISDLHGLFYSQRFFPCSHKVRVLPSCVQADSFPPMTKQHNSLMPPGMHRFLRAGSGPELLELREYVPGDPPKSIAWKVSARRGALMTRQYESEVPVRVTVFVDCSAGARVGVAGHRAIDTAISTAASLSKAVMADRDPVGLIVYDDEGTKPLKHGAGERHLFRILGALADRSFLDNPGAIPFSSRLLDHAWTVCEDLYPELLEPSVNQMPFMIFPILPGRRRLLKRRLQLATVIAELFSLPADGAVRLAVDNLVMAKFIYKFLARIGAPWTDAVYNVHGANVVAGKGRLGVLCDSLTRAVALARDNEVFVLVADLIDHAGKLGRLIDAVRVARARHHRVIVICPWPAPVTADKLPGLSNDVIKITRRAEQLRLDGAAELLRAEFRKLQIPFAMATEGKSIRLVLAEASLARDGRTAMAGAR